MSKNAKHYAELAEISRHMAIGAAIVAVTCIARALLMSEPAMSALFPLVSAFGVIAVALVDRWRASRSGNRDRWGRVEWEQSLRDAHSDEGGAVVEYRINPVEGVFRKSDGTEVRFRWAPIEEGR